jgi:hypothetical protein
MIGHDDRHFIMLPSQEPHDSADRDLLRRDNLGIWTALRENPRRQVIEGPDLKM